MKARILVGVVVALLLGLGLTPAAQAKEAEGTGRVWARGVGYAEVHGDGIVDISAHGAGTILIKGAEVLHVQGQGHRWDRPDGTVILTGWRGSVHMAGHDLTVRMVGGLIEFEAVGTGWVFVKGRGHFRIGGREGLWTLDGLRLDF